MFLGNRGVSPAPRTGFEQSRRAGEVDGFRTAQRFPAVTLASMPHITHLLDAAAAGDRRAAADLLPLVYDELRAVAAAHLAGEKPDHTLGPTALVHEAYLRLTGGQG